MKTKALEPRRGISMLKVHMLKFYNFLFTKKEEAFLFWSTLLNGNASLILLVRAYFTQNNDGNDWSNTKNSSHKKQHG